MAPLVSTIVPVYNRPRMVREAVASVLAQTHRPIEIVIVDDGSTDETPAVVDALSHGTESVVRVLHVPNGGPGAAREAGRRLARGAYIQYLDSDDLLEPRKFEMQIAALESDPPAGIAYGWTRLVRENGDADPIPWKRTGEEVRTMFPSFLIDRWWDTSTPLYRRCVVDRAGPWLSLRAEEDWEYDARIAAMGVELRYCPAWVSTTRLVESRLSGRQSRQTYLDRAAAHRAVYLHAVAAGVHDDSPEMMHFSRKLFLLARQCGAAGLPDESRMLFRIARASAGRRANGLDFRAYRAATRLLGWTTAGRLALLTDRLRRA